MTARTPTVLIVGAGPAGTRAAETLVAAGLAPIVVDEAPRNGGQAYRQQPPGFTRPARTLYGFEARKAQAIHRTFDRLEARVDFRPSTLVWSIGAGTAHLQGPEGITRLRYDVVLLATGAMDRLIPFPGWTLPGVFTMGGAQVALKSQGCAVGDPMVFMGTGPLLYLVAVQYAHAGAKVAAVLDTARFTDALPALPGLLAGRTTFAMGIWYMTWLKLHGVPVHRGITPVAAEGDGHIEAVRYQDARGRTRRVACAGLGFGYGVKSEVQLADLLDCPMAYDPLARQWLPIVDANGRAEVPNVYLAGDGAGIAGADAAELRGELAALAILEDHGHPVAAARQAKLRRALARIGRFRVALERALPFPDRLAPALPDDTIVCRCEAITAGDLRHAQGLTPEEINRAKAYTRAGMGRCQGRVCGIAAAQILADTLGCSPDAVGRMRGQAPVKPIAIGAGALAAEEDPERAASI